MRLLPKRLPSGTAVHFAPETKIVEEPDGSWTLRGANDKTYARMPAGGHYFDFVRPTMSGKKIDPECPFTNPDDRA